MVKVYSEIAEVYDSMLIDMSGSDMSIITTFGLYVGITHDNDYSNEHPSVDRAFLDRITANNVNFIIGTSDYRPCGHSKICKFCEIDYVKRHLRLIKTADAFKHINFRLLDKLGSKLAVILKSDSIIAYVGSHNVSGSEFKETIVKFETNTDILKLALSNLAQSIAVDIDNIYKFLLNQSQNGLQLEAAMEDIYGSNPG